MQRIEKPDHASVGRIHLIFSKPETKINGNCNSAVSTIWIIGDQEEITAIVKWIRAQLWKKKSSLTMSGGIIRQWAEHKQGEVGDKIIRLTLDRFVISHGELATSTSRNRTMWSPRILPILVPPLWPGNDNTSPWSCATRWQRTSQRDLVPL